MLRENSTRTDFATRLQRIIDEYNAGSSSADNYFDELVKFTKELKDESERHIREGLTTDELELFDLIKRSKMTKEETIKVRLFATRDGSPFDRHNLTRRQLKSTCRKLGLEGVSWHWLRHANATLLDAVGTPLGTVQALLGHSSSEITREVYLHSIPADARKAVEKVEEKLNRLKLTQVRETWGNGSSLIQ